METKYLCGKLFFNMWDMNEPYSILMQKTTENAPVKDSLVHFGIVCTEFPFKPGGETKDLPKRDWSDEDGEDYLHTRQATIKSIRLGGRDVL